MPTVTARRSFGIARRVVGETRARDVPTFAAAVADDAFVSVVPLLALALLAAGAVGGAALEAVVADLAGRYLLPTGREMVVEALLGTAFGAYAAYAGGVAVYGVLGGLVLLVGAVTNAVLAGRLDSDRQVQHASSRDDPTMAEEGPDDADSGTGPSNGTDGDGRPPAGGHGDDPDAGDGPDPDGAGAAATDADEGRTSPDAATDRDGGPADATAARQADVAELEERVASLRDELDAFREDVDRRTLHRDEVRADLRRYVRRRVRRGHARGWGPYLVLLYGTVMTLGAFYFLDGVWAVLAMVVLFLSTLGLYALFVLVGVGLNLLGTPRKAYERVREFRE